MLSLGGPTKKISSGGLGHLIWMRTNSSSSWKSPPQFGIKNFVNSQSSFFDLLFSYENINNSDMKIKSYVLYILTS